jgi:hypothetical protein
MNYTDDILYDAGYDDDIQSMAIKKVSKNAKVQNVLHTIADDSMVEDSLIHIYQLHL